MTDALNKDVFQAVIDHTFMPPKLPQNADDEEKNHASDVLLTVLFSNFACSYARNLSDSDRGVWRYLERTLKHLHDTTRMGLKRETLTSTLSQMEIGGV